MAHSNVSELLAIYNRAYTHCILSMKNHRDGIDECQLIGQLEEIAKFANLIATEPDSIETKEMAESYDTFIDTFHEKMLKKMEKRGQLPVETCICLGKQIDQYVKKYEDEATEASKNKVDESESEDEDYLKWMEIQYEFRRMFE